MTKNGPQEGGIELTEDEVLANALTQRQHKNQAAANTCWKDLWQYTTITPQDLSWSETLHPGYITAYYKNIALRYTPTQDNYAGEVYGHLSFHNSGHIITELAQLAERINHAENLTRPRNPSNNPPRPTPDNNWADTVAGGGYKTKKKWWHWQ